MGFIRESVLVVLQKNRDDISTVLKMIGMDGGAGSGNFGHSGRPGKRGGSAKRGSGGGSVSKERAKEIKKDRDNFKKLDTDAKIKTLSKLGQIAYPSLFSSQEALVRDYAEKHKMSVDKYLDWRAARYFTMRKFQPEIEYKTPLKSKEVQNNHLDAKGRFDYIKNHTGCSNQITKKMSESLSDHFGSSNADCEWTDKFIDADGRYEGPIYRWKSYSGDKAKKVVAGLVPGAKIGNKHESNWSFSSDPWVTSHFGSYNSEMDDVSIRYTCDRNITGSPVQCLSGFGSSEAEVIPHSKTTYTITSVEKVKMPNGGTMYDVHMVEDDWHEERGIPVWKPTGDEIDGGWRETFPKDDDGASNIYEDLKKEIKNNPATLKEFKDACPGGTEFYQITNDKIYFVRKEDNDDNWIVADITDKYNENVDKFFFGNVEEGEDFDENAWGTNDKHIWDKLKGTNDYKHMPSVLLNNFLKSDDTMLIQVGGKEKTKEDKVKEWNKALKDMNNLDYNGNNEEFFENLPEGTSISDKDNKVVFLKNEIGDFDLIDADTGEKLAITYSPYKMGEHASFGTNSLEIIGESGESTEKNEPDMSGAFAKHDDFISHSTYGGVESKMLDFKGVEGKEKEKKKEECEEWISGLKDGTEFTQNGGGGLRIVKEDGKWSGYKKDDADYHETYEPSLVAWCLMYKDLDFSLSKLPVDIPEDASDANSMFNGIKIKKPEQMEEFAKKAPDGTVVMDNDVGWVYCKNKGKWEAMVDEDYDPDKDWSEFREYAISNLDQDYIPQKFNSDGTFVLKVGKKGE